MNSPSRVREFTEHRVRVNLTPKMYDALLVLCNRHGYRPSVMLRYIITWHLDQKHKAIHEYPWSEFGIRKEFKHSISLYTSRQTVHLMGAYAAKTGLSNTEIARLALAHYLWDHGYIYLPQMASKVEPKVIREAIRNGVV